MMKQPTRRRPFTPWAGLPLLLLLALPAFPQGGPQQGGPRGSHGGHGPGGEGRSDAVLEFLQLTDEQIAEWRSLHQAHGDEVRSILEGQRELRGDLREALEAESPDANTIGELVIASHQTEASLAASRKALQSNLAALLTPDQLVRYEALQAARALGRGGMRMRRGPRMGRGGGG